MKRDHSDVRATRASFVRASLRVGLALTVLAGATVGEARAQVELIPFIGYRAFGSLTDYTGTNISTSDAMSYGGILGVATAPSTRVEFSFSRQDTHVVLTEPFQGRSRYDVNVDEWTLGGLQELGMRQTAVRPFATAYLGLSNLSSSDGAGSVQKFMLGAGIGGKTATDLSPVGVRLEARGYFSFVGGGGASVVCGTGGCGFGFGGDAFFQMDFIAGVVLGFGQGR